jgi:hypothetical protein
LNFIPRKKIQIPRGGIKTGEMDGQATTPNKRALCKKKQIPRGGIKDSWIRWDGLRFQAAFGLTDHALETKKRNKPFGLLRFLLSSVDSYIPFTFNFLRTESLHDLLSLALVNAESSPALFDRLRGGYAFWPARSDLGRQRIQVGPGAFFVFLPFDNATGIRSATTCPRYVTWTSLPVSRTRRINSLACCFSSRTPTVTMSVSFLMYPTFRTPRKFSLYLLGCGYKL